MLVTSVDGDVMQDTKCADDLLETYYRELVDHVTHGGASMGRYSAETMMQDVEMAMVDWFRFQAGWGFWGNSWVLEARVKGIFRGVNGGNASRSPLTQVPPCDSFAAREELQSVRRTCSRTGISGVS